jgi:mono/diheme cytochrome c family protein
MKKFMKIVGILLGIVVISVAGGIIYLTTRYPDVGPAPNVKIEVTQDRIKRGDYLANHVAVCIDCHSTRDWSYFSGPITSGTEGKGGETFGEEFGFPGTFYSRNITPAGIGNWTDGELVRTITTGVNKNNEALFPIMPYPNFNSADEEDIYSIVAYVRSLKPIENKIKERHLNFPMNIIIHTIPQPAHFQKRPSSSDTLAYGKYLATIASCGFCHTQSEKGEPLPGMSFAGGFVFPLPWGTVRSANITPDIETGIGTWSKAQFIGKFKNFDSETARHIVMKPPYSEAYYNTVMPWTMFAGMTEEDLGAIYSYLRTVAPVAHKVQKYSSEGAAY